jgi:hypothetical protein
MKSISPRIARIQELITLEEKRSSLEEQMESLISRMSSLRDGLFEENAASRSVQTSTTSKSPTPAKATRGRSKKRAGRGELKSQMFDALKAAGSAPVRVADLASSLGLNPTNVHAWFHNAAKKFSQIKKAGRGEYVLKGELPNTETSDGTVEAATKGKAGARKAGGKKAGGSKRGALSAAILEALSNAGAKGITVKDLAAQVGVPYKNVYIWFATTGKKNAKVKKVAPATFKLAA